MFLFKRFKIRSYEIGLYFRDGEFRGLLTAGRYWLFDPLWRVRERILSALGECTIAELAADVPPPTTKTAVLHTHL